MSARKTTQERILELPEIVGTGTLTASTVGHALRIDVGAARDALEKLVVKAHLSISRGDGNRIHYTRSMGKNKMITGAWR